MIAALQKGRHTRSTVVVCWCLATVACVSSGCSRAFYRQQADCDAYNLIHEKTCDPGWPLDGYTIEIDPMSRMYDPFNADCPPMPPDDPTAHSYLHCVDGKHGYPCWHVNGDTDQVEGPSWEDSLPRCDNGHVLIGEQLAVELALLHSPTYQRELEDLYLSALDVSFERFRFDTQFFGGKGLIYTADGRDRSGLGESVSRLDLSSRNVEARRLFATGGELVVGLANSLLWQFAGPTTNATNTLLDFSFVQPLLRMGGRVFVLERLTIAERALLANVRQMERFRRGFYLEIITGRNAGPGPSRRGGVFGGAGLEGFSGVGGGGFGQLAGGATTGGGAGGVTGGAGAAQAGGFLGLLQTQQDMRNQQANIAALESSVAQLDAFFRAGRINYFQVELARQALFNAQSRLLNTQLGFRNDKDQFKFDLGIAPHITIELDDTLIKPLQLIDPEAIASQNELTALQRKLGQVVIEIIQIADEAEKNTASDADPASEVENLPTYDAAPGESSSGGRPPHGVFAASYAQSVEVDPAGRQDDARRLEWNDALRGKLAELRRLIQEAKSLSDQSNREGVPRAASDIKDLESSLKGRDESMRKLRDSVQRRLDELADTCGDEPPPSIDAESILPFDPARLAKLPRQLEATTADVESRFVALSKIFDEFDQEIAQLLEEGESLQPTALYQRLSQRIFAPVPNALNELSANILGMILVQVRARTQKASLVPVEMDWRDAVETARLNRRDWMNARAGLVDSWRLIQFNANALESDLDLIFNGDISNVGDNPFDLRGSTGRLQVGIEFDAPLTRLAERNNYRQALIEYQQARRGYYRLVDQISNGLRSVLRGLEINQVNFELRRAAVEVAIAQVELARLTLQEPPRPDEPSDFGATTARDLVTALTDLLNVQNDFLSVWINQESLRRSLDFDLGTMQLDATSIWIDPGPISALATDPSLSVTDFPVWDENGIQRLPDPITDGEDGVLFEETLEQQQLESPLGGPPHAAHRPAPNAADPEAELLQQFRPDFSATSIPTGETDPTAAVAPVSATSIGIFEGLTERGDGDVKWALLEEPRDAATDDSPNEQRMLHEIQFRD